MNIFSVTHNNFAMKMLLSILLNFQNVCVAISWGFPWDLRCRGHSTVARNYWWQQDKTRPNVKYLLYRTLHTVYLLTTWIITLGGQWYIYLTRWGYTLLTMQSMMCWVMLIVATVTRKMSKDSHSNECFLKSHCIYWVIHSATNATGFLITIIYWTAIHGPADLEFTPSTFYVHGTNSMAIILDLCISAHPVYLSHCIYPLFFNVAYLTFNVAFYFYDKGRGGNGLIYNILDWNYPGKTTGVVIGIFFVVLVLHILTYIIYRVRVFIHNKLIDGVTSNNSGTLHV